MQNLTIAQKRIIKLSKLLYNLGDYISETKFVNTKLGYFIYNWCILKSVTITNEVEDRDYLWKD